MQQRSLTTLRIHTFKRTSHRTSHLVDPDVRRDNDTSGQAQVKTQAKRA